MEKDEIISIAHSKMVNEGYNCAQSIVYGMIQMIKKYQHVSLEKENEYHNIARAFGGGVGGLRQTCGYIAGSGIAYSLLIADDDLIREKVQMVNDIVVKETSYWDCASIISSYPDDTIETRKSECVKILDTILEYVYQDIADIYN